MEANGSLFGKRIGIALCLSHLQSPEISGEIKHLLLTGAEVCLVLLDPWKEDGSCRKGDNGRKQNPEKSAAVRTLARVLGGQAAGKPGMDNEAGGADQGQAEKKEMKGTKGAKGTKEEQNKQAIDEPGPGQQVPGAGAGAQPGTRTGQELRQEKEPWLEPEPEPEPRQEWGPGTGQGWEEEPGQQPVPGVKLEKRQTQKPGPGPGTGPDRERGQLDLWIVVPYSQPLLSYLADQAAAENIAVPLVLLPVFGENPAGALQLLSVLMENQRIFFVPFGVLLRGSPGTTRQQGKEPENEPGPFFCRTDLLVETCLSALQGEKIRPTVWDDCSFSY